MGDCLSSNCYYNTTSFNRISLLTRLKISYKFLIDRVLLKVLLVVFDEFRYLLNQLVLGEWLLRGLRGGLLLLGHVDLCSRWLVERWLWGLVAADIGRGAESWSLGGLLRLSVISPSIVRVTTHRAREEVLLLHLMLDLLLLLSGDRAFIGRCTFDRISGGDTWCVHRGRRDTSGGLFAYLGLSHSGGVVLLLLRDSALGTPRIVALLGGGRNFKALNEFLVVLTRCTLPISYTFYCMLQIIYEK